MTFDPGSLGYQILDECKCGPEEFFVLVSSVEEDGLETFLQLLVELVAKGQLKCDRGVQENIPLSIEDLHAYVANRREAGEDLGQYPAVCEEFCFTTTESGIEFLRPEDRPIPA